MELDVIGLTEELIGFRTPSQASNAPLAGHLQHLLTQLGFTVEEVAYEYPAGVAKVCLVARLGDGEGGLSLCSHSDVVPAAAADGWTVDPFCPRRADGRVYGRGACDMKGPLAATLTAAARYRGRRLQAPLFLVITADEELQARGARQVIERSRLFAAAASGYGVLCEPTGLQVVHAHKGALAITVTARGRAAHTSTLRGVNANARMIPFLADMKRIYDLVLTSPRYRNEAYTPPCSEWSLGLCDHNIATNMTPARSVCTISYRPMPGVDAEGLVRRTERSAARHGLECEVVRVGDPLYTPPDSPWVQLALRAAGRRRPQTVPYGTDGMIFVQRMPQLLVLGPGHIAQAHTVDEWIATRELERAVEVYSRLIERVCVPA